jgi:hypothetical protein
MEKLKMFCDDPFLTYLKSYGYNPIRLPKADPQPLQLLVREGSGDLTRLGDLATLMVSGNNIPLPSISKDVRTANISGQRTSDLSIGIGLSILTSIIGAVGGSTLGLDVKYKEAQSAAFEFQDVYEDKIDLVKLDQFLADADVNPFSVYVSKLLDADELFVITATIKSNKFTVEARKSNNVGLDLNVPEIQEVVGGNIQVSGAATATSKITYDARIPLVFGFQAVQLFYDRGRYTSFEPLSSGSMAMKDLSNVPEDGRQRLMTNRAFIRLSDL